MDPKARQLLPWVKVQTDPQGSMAEMIPPALAIAAVCFHPKIYPSMWKRAMVLHEDGPHGEPEGGGRLYSHPFTCDEALRAQAVVDAKPVREGETNLLVGWEMAKDKTELERMKSADALHGRPMNIARKDSKIRESKILQLISPPFKRDDDASAQDNARAKQFQAQRSNAMFLVMLQACARLGIKCTLE